MIALTLENFETEVLQAQKAVIVKVYTDSCPKCKQMEPVFEALAQENEQAFKFANWKIESPNALLKKYKILAVPSFLFFKNGELLHRKVGVIAVKEILQTATNIQHINAKTAKAKALKGWIDWSAFKFWG